MDIELFYREAGQGKPLILLHGNGEESGYFVHQMEAFAPYFHVFALDTRGHGRTPRGTAPFTIRQFVEDLLTWMDGMSIPRAHLLGFSDGANIAMCFALAHPQRVGRLVLNGGNLSPRGVKPAVQIPVELGYRAAALLAVCSRQAERKAELLRLMVRDPALTPQELAGIQAKTLVIAGTDDMIREKHTRLIAEAIPGAQLSFLPGDHFLANRAPDAFNRRVLDFLRG